MVHLHPYFRYLLFVLLYLRESWLWWNSCTGASWRKVEPTAVGSWRRIYIYNPSLDCALVEYKYMDYKYTYRMKTPICGFMGFLVAQQVFFGISKKNQQHGSQILRLENLVISDPHFRGRFQPGGVPSGVRRIQVRNRVKMVAYTPLN